MDNETLEAEICDLRFNLESRLDEIEELHKLQKVRLLYTYFFY